jgi:hypothetical protein
METYSEIKEDVKFLVEETVNMGNQIQGGLGRACVEYWLDSIHVEAHGPNFVTKFMASMAILKMYVDGGLELDYSLKEIAFYLLAKLSESDKKSMSDNCIKEILRDSKDIYEFNWYVVHNCLSRNT